MCFEDDRNLRVQNHSDIIYKHKVKLQPVQYNTPFIFFFQTPHQSVYIVCSLLKQTIVTILRAGLRKRREFEGFSCLTTVQLFARDTHSWCHKINKSTDTMDNSVYSINVIFFFLILQLRGFYIANRSIFLRYITIWTSGLVPLIFRSWRSAMSSLAPFK